MPPPLVFRAASRYDGGVISGSPESFTPEERARLAPHFTSLDGPVFALVNLPEVVKGALFARYSRSPKSLRRLFLDEFAGRETTSAAEAAVGVARAESLYERVFLEYGDDSVAQLGGVHLACEGVSNVMTKLLEWGRLMAYLEQSTRYIPYTDRPGGRWRYHVPEELTRFPALERRYVETLDLAFETYARWLEPMQAHVARRHPRDPGDPEGVYRATIRAKALDTLRGLLPAATLANVGLYGTGQAYEALLLRLRANPLAEAQAYADLMLTELKKVIPSFLRRVEVPDRGGAWTQYLRETREATRSVAGRLLADLEPESRDEVVLTDFDADGEVKVVAAALYAVSDLPDDQLLARAREMSAEQRDAVLEAYVGERANRRHKPGRAFERTAYRFDVLTDYGAFRDLQRHRLLTVEWQPLGPRHGYRVPEAVAEAGAGEDWRRTMDASAALYEALSRAGLAAAAPYGVCMAYRIRFYMEMNARETMHVIELRTSPQGHPSYRRVCQAMHRLIEQHHPALARAMRYVNHSETALDRRDAEWRTEARRFYRTLDQLGLEPITCQVEAGPEAGRAPAWSPTA
ncbi:MAG: FAD-dependent thymidylate synthase [Candidatus Rokubacteria bacterium]|nr:FAD-dependent thymidylate synthase [Candidatus Rokubacteria bacterium]